MRIRPAALGFLVVVAVASHAEAGHHGSHVVVPHGQPALRVGPSYLYHYEENHFIALELGGNPRDAKNLWPEMWGTPGTPLTYRGPFPPSRRPSRSSRRTGSSTIGTIRTTYCPRCFPV